MAKFASKLRYGSGAFDWDEGINFDRMRKERLAKAQSSLKKEGIAACLLTRPENMRYVTGTKAVDFIDQLRYTVTFADYEPVLYEMPPGKLFGSCPWIKPENLKLSILWANGSCGKEATRETAKIFAESIKQDLKEKGLEKEKLGVDLLDIPGLQALKEAGIEVVDAMPALLEARKIKTEDEINCLKIAVSVSEVGWYALYEALKPGITGYDLRAAASNAMLKVGAESVWDVLTGAGGPGHLDKVVQVGDIVTSDFVRTSYMGYCTCYYRNIIVGRKPNDKEKELQKRSYERMYKVIDAIKPGVTTADLAKHWITAGERGYASESNVWCEDLGHGIGLWLYEYPIINRLWSLEHPMTIQKGMTMAVEAMEFDPDIGRTKLDEMVVVTDNGAEVITKMPAKDMMVASPIIVA
jgi:Xaa-Pro aminopeptidase